MQIYLSSHDSQAELLDLVQQTLAIGYAQVLQVLDELAKNMGKKGLGFWEKLAESQPT